MIGTYQSKFTCTHEFRSSFFCLLSSRSLWKGLWEQVRVQLVKGEDDEGGEIEVVQGEDDEE